MPLTAASAPSSRKRRRPTARAAEHHEQRDGAARGGQDRDRPNQHVRRLERLHPAGEQHHLAIDGQVEPRTERVPAARARANRVEQCEVHAGGDDVHRGGVGVVQVDEVSRLLDGARQECVRRRDHLALTDQAAGRLGVSPGASAAFLTLASVCMVCTNGTSQRSATNQPTWPDSQ